MNPQSDFETLYNKYKSLMDAERFHAVQVGLQHSTVCWFVR